MLLEAKLITPEEARNHPQKNVITRYLGMNSEYACDATVGKKIPFSDGDRFLLCSDGVSDMLTDEALEALLQENEEVETCVRKIRDAVCRAGARDNLTVILLEFIVLDQLDTLPIDTDCIGADDEPTVEGNDGTVKAQTAEGTGGTVTAQVNIRVTGDRSTECKVLVFNKPSQISLRFE